VPSIRLTRGSALTARTPTAIPGLGRRFRRDAELVLYAGVAPLKASSAGLVPHQVNRSGHQRLNAILYRIALTQMGHSPPARAYVAQRVGESKTKREAIRALKRYIVCAIWRLWQKCLPVAEPAVNYPNCPGTQLAPPEARPRRAPATRRHCGRQAPAGATLPLPLRPKRLP